MKSIKVYESSDIKALKIVCIGHRNVKLVDANNTAFLISHKDYNRVLCDKINCLFAEKEIDGSLFGLNLVSFENIAEPKA